MALEVASRTGRELPLLAGMIDIGSLEYWTGWTMAHVSWYLNINFQTLQARNAGLVFGLYVNEMCFAPMKICTLTNNLSVVMNFGFRNLSRS